MLNKKQANHWLETAPCRQ